VFLVASISAVLNRTLFEPVIDYGEMISSMASTLLEALKQLSLLETARGRELLARVIILDTEADNYRRMIVEGGITRFADPVVREDVRLLLRMLDRVSEWIKAGALHLDLVPYLSVSSNTRSKIEELVKLAVSGIQTLVKALRELVEGNFEKALNLCLEIEKIEENADRALHEARKSLIEEEKTLKSVVQLMFLKDLIEDLEKITDYEEDAGDVVIALIHHLKTRTNNVDGAVQHNKL